MDELIAIPVGARGRVTVEWPRYMYHNLKARDLAADGGIEGYPLPPGERELAEDFPVEMREGGFVFLSRKPLMREALKVDLTRLNLAAVRPTGQAEGNAIVAGRIPKEAIVETGV